MSVRSSASWVAPALLVAGSLLCCVIVSELALRVFWDGYYLKTGEPYAAGYPRRWWANLPNVRVAHGEVEFSTTVVHNEWGFRGPPLALEKDPDRIRVLMLGDSFTWGVGVENDETYSAELTRLDPRIEAINTGVNGYGTNQELLLLVEDGLRFAPDVVVVAFFWNDVNRSRPAFELTDGGIVYPGPLPEELWRQANETKRDRRTWLRYSYLYRFVSDRIKLVRTSIRYRFGLEELDESKLKESEFDYAWAVTLATLAETRRVAEANGAEMLLMVIPDQAQVEPDAYVLGLDEREYRVQPRLAAFAEAEGIAYLDLLPALREARERGGEALYYRLDRHLRPAGQRVVAEQLHAKLAEMGVLER